jgi:hypothetical protein
MTGDEPALEPPLGTPAAEALQAGVDFEGDPLEG